jgi:hypothetical protein
MDASRNPFAPGAGTQPPEFAGQSGIFTDAEVSLARARRGQGKSSLFLDLRGVGKTVLLNKIAETAQSVHAMSVALEAPEEQRLAEMPLREPQLRTA